MKAVFMGKHKRSAVGALEHLVQRGWEVVAVVAPEQPGLAGPEQRLDMAASRHGIAAASDDDLYAAIEDPGGARIDLEDVDFVLSFLFWKRIRTPLIELGSAGCLNFHPSPLPDIRGLGGYNVAILEGLAAWGVSAHFVDSDFDTGDIVRVDRFPIDPADETALSLDIVSQERLLALFGDVVDLAATGEPLPRIPQGEGRYVTREEFEGLRRVRPGDPPELTERRMRAFWYPPHDGATIEVAGRTLTLVDRLLLEQAAEANRDAGIFS
ncbi:MAG: formyl transferase [Thermoleophilaceae bacterium]|nr:formyl transferase [Thermoleophilaceae bacterium]